MDTIKPFSLSLVLTMLFFGMPLSAQEVAYPKYSPLPVYGAHPGDDETSRQLSVEFGDALPVIELDNDTVLVSLPNNAGMARFKLADVVLSDGLEHIRPGPNFQLKDRASLSFWDSKLRAQGFLQNGPSVDTSPLLSEFNVTEGIPNLPVLELSIFHNSLGREVQIAQSLVPASDEFLKNLILNEQQAAEEIELHIVVDGSSYARDFAQRRLNAFSRRVAASDDLKEMTLTRTVILENGETVGPDAIQISGLRQLFPQSSTSGSNNGTLSQGFTEALQNLTAMLEGQEASDRSRIILILLGPGVRENILDDPEFKSVASALRQQMRANRFGVMIGTITPEPSEIPNLLLSQLGIGIPSNMVAFTDQLDHSLSRMSDEISALRSTGERNDERCYFDLDQQTLCLFSENMEAVGRILAVPDETELEWFAVPLWHIVDGATLVLERNLMSQTDAVLPLRQTGNKDNLINYLRADLTALQEEFDNLTELQIAKSHEMATELANWSAREVGLEASLDAANAKQDELRSALVLAREDVVFLEARLKEVSEQYLDEQDNRTQLQQELAKVSELLRTVEAQKRRLERSLSGLAMEKSSAEQRASGLLEENSQLVSELSEMNVANTALQGIIARQDVSIENARQALAGEQSKADSLTEELQATVDEKNIVTALLSEKNTQIQEIEDEKLSLEAFLEEKDARISLLDTEISSLQAKYDLTIRQVEEASAESEERQLRIDELERLIEGLQAQNSVLLADKRSLIEQTSLLELQLADLEKANSEKSTTIIELQDENKTLKLVNDNVSTELLAVDQELTNQIKSYSNLELKFNEAENKINEFIEENAQLRASILASDMLISDLQTERNEIFSLLEERSESLLQTQTALQEVGELTAIDVTGDDLPTVIEKYKNAMMAAQEQVQVMSDTQRALEDELEVTKTRLAHQTADYAVESARSSSDKAQSRRAILDLEARLAERQRELSELQTAKAALSGQLEKRNELISQAENMLKAMGDRLSIDVLYADLPEAINIYSEVLIEAIAQSGELSNQNKNLEAELAEMKKDSEYDQLEDNEIVIRLRETIGAKDNRILQIEAEMMELRSENEKMRERIEIAMGVAEENVQLISAINNAERIWLNREAALQNEIKLLNQKLRRAETTNVPSNQGDAVEQVVQPTDQLARLDMDSLELSTSLRPMARPQNLTTVARSSPIAAQPTRETPPQRNSSRRAASNPTTNQPAKPDALPGSLFVQPSTTRSASGGFQSSGGFFGN